MLASTSAVQVMIGAPALTAGVAGEHADVGRAEHVAKGEELLTDQCLDRRGVVATPSRCQRRVQRAGGHQRLARAGRRRQDDVRAADQLDQGLLLRRVQQVPLASAQAAKEANSSSGSAPFARNADRSPDVEQSRSSAVMGWGGGRDIVRTSVPDGHTRRRVARSRAVDSPKPERHHRAEHRDDRTTHHHRRH